MEDTKRPEAHLSHAWKIQIAAGRDILDGDLAVPENPRGAILFAHGSGSSRHSPRNRSVAQALNTAGLATLLLDLLTQQEEAEDSRTGQYRFDIPRLADRIVAAAEWLKHEPETETLAVGYFGASTGGGAALLAAAERPDLASAIVSRGGRPDLAGEALARVHAPTLLIVGANDEQVVAVNRDALDRILTTDKTLVLVPGATHLFEEMGALEEVARLATDWFVHHLGREASAGVRREWEVGSSQ